MKLLNRLSLRASVLLYASIALTATLVMTYEAWHQNGEVEQLTDRLLADVNLAKALGLTDMMHDALRGDVAAVQLAALAPEIGDVQDVLAETREHVATLTEQHGRLREHVQSGPATDALAAVGPVLSRYGESAERFVASVADGNAASARERDAFEADFQALEEGLGAFLKLVSASAAETTRQRERLLSGSLTIALTTLCISSVLLLGGGYWFSRRLLRVLGAEPDSLRRFVLAIADGHLHASLERDRAWPGSVGDAMDAMRDQLRDVVTTIREQADGVVACSGQLGHGNQALASRSSDQSRQLQESAAAIEEMTSTIRLTTDHASSANDLASDAASAAQRGGEVVERAVLTMQDIKTSSGRIASIIEVIDGIAFQTNILALNAAVEAARAGEQGRGFAVVAGEVGSLAQRTAEAAREVKVLIGESVEKVNVGHSQVSDARKTTDEVVTKVRSASELIGQISSATSEQNTTIGMINTAVSTLDRDSQHNTLLVEQGSETVESLDRQARRLAEAVARFELDSGSSLPVPGSRKPALDEASAWQRAA